MKTVTITWQPPSFLPYTALSNVLPGTLWAASVEDPRIASYIVERRYRLTDDFERVGEVTSPSIDVPIDDTNELQVRVQTVLVNGDKTGFATTGLRPIMGMEAVFREPTNVFMLAII